MVAGVCCWVEKRAESLRDRPRPPGPAQRGAQLGSSAVSQGLCPRGGDTCGALGGKGQALRARRAAWMPLLPTWSLCCSHLIVLRITTHAESTGAPGVSGTRLPPPGIEDRLLFLFQQQQLQHLSHHVHPLALTPHPSSVQLPSLAGASSAAGLLALSGALMAQSQLAAKEDRVAQDGESRGEGLSTAGLALLSLAESVLGGQHRGARVGRQEFCCLLCLFPRAP